MTDPIQFDTATPRHSFPMLAAGQAQKELFVNEALARIDTLLHPAVEGEASDPPVDPEAGKCWLVAGNATGEWIGQDGRIAGWDGTQWTFCAPQEGMLVFDLSSGKRHCYAGGWHSASRPASPSGGSIVDQEARAAIDAIIATLQTLRFIGQS